MQFIKDLQSDLISVKLDHQEESLVKRANHLYNVSNAKSKTEINDEIYNLTQIYITPPIHEGKHDYEMVCVYSGHKRALFTFFLKKDTTPVLTIPFEHIDLAILDSYIHTNFHYNNDSREHIFVCTTPIPINDSSIEIHGNPSRLYKQIYEPTIFSQLSFLFTQKDSVKKIVILHENITIKRGNIEKIQEGFSDTYMQCELVEDDGNGNLTDISEYAITPLNASMYQRGMVTFTTFLHLMLCIVAGGIVIPSLLCGPFIHATPIDWSFHLFGSILHAAFFLVAIVCMAVGLDNKQSAVATVGFYFSVVVVSNIIGTTYMLPSSGHYSKDKLIDWFNKDNPEAMKPLWNIAYPFNGYSYRAV